MSNLLNGLDTYVLKDGTILVPLPAELCSPDNGCCCRHCKAARENGESPSGWNALAVHPKSAYSWTVHLPKESIGEGLRNGSLRMAGKRKRKASR